MQEISITLLQENIDMATIDGKIKTYEGGLHTDFSPENQPDGTLRFALNAVLIALAPVGS